MIAILKTLPARFARGQLERFLGLDGKPCWTTYFFTLGRGKPKKADVPGEFSSTDRPASLAPGRIAIDVFDKTPGWKGIDLLYFTHRGVLIGWFEILCIVQNVGQLPQLTNLDGDPSAWQIKGDRWVAVCDPPFHRLEEKLFHEGFRGWRYFDLEKYRGTHEAKVRL